MIARQLLISCWGSLGAVRACAGEAYEPAVLYPGDERYRLQPDPTVRHFRVDEDHRGGSLRLPGALA